MEKQTIGKFIAALRRANGMTQADLAEKLGVSNKSVSKWECDDGYPDLSLIPLIAGIFNVTSDEILKGGRIIQSGNGIANDDPKIEKQVKLLVKRKLTNFKYVSLIPIFLSVIGFVFLILPTLLHTGGSFAIICLVLFLLLNLSSIIVESIFANRARMSIFSYDEDEEPNKEQCNAIKTIQNVVFNIVTINIIFITAIPFLYMSGLKIYFFLLFAPVLYIAAFIIKMIASDKKYIVANEYARFKQSIKTLNKVCLIASAVFFLLPIVLSLIEYILNQSAGMSTIADHAVIYGESRFFYNGFTTHVLIFSSIALIVIGLLYIYKRRKKLNAL